MSIKPFYVYKPSRDEAVEIVERIIANGGECYDAVAGMDANPGGGVFQHDEYPCWGFSLDERSYTGRQDWDGLKNATQLTMPQVRAMLPCEKYDGNNEWPKPGVWVMSLGGAKMFYVGLDSTGRNIFELENGGLTVFDNLCGFKPLPTARENFIERTIEIIGDEEGTIEEILGRLFDAGLAKDIEE